MQGLCHLSRRWHQQFCRSPSFSSHQKCLLRFYHPSPLSLARQPGGGRPQPPPKKATAIRQGDLVVREYEQDDQDSPSTRRPIDHGQDPLVRETQRIKAEMQALNEELESLKEGPFGPNSEFMQSIPKDERERLLKELDAQGLQYDSLKDIDFADDISFDPKRAAMSQPEDSQHLNVSMRVADRHKAWVGEFNSALHQAQDKPYDLLSHRLLWKWYLRCQQKVPGFSSFVNEDVWHFLWRSQMMTYPGTKHIIMLAKDMKVADIDLDHSQGLDYIDALHATEDTASAIQEWEKEKDSIAKEVGEDDAYKAVAKLNDDFTNRFWATGVNLYASVGRPAKAETVAFKSLERRGFSGGDSQASMILVDVIRAWAHSQRTDADVKLWSCYMLMREKAAEFSKTTLPIEVLGQITSALLKTGRQQMALAVFQDMLAAHTGNKFASNIDLQKQASKSLSLAEGSAVNESIINQVGLAALLVLPSRFRNKFFFGSWIKWLIGQDKVDDAALVVELMQEYDVKPDARHLNGIIGAWLRHGSPTARDKAEQMAWAMIHARIDLVKARTPDLPDFKLLASNTLDPAQELTPYSTRAHLPVFLQRNIPPATIETFSVLLLRYTRAHDMEKSTQITDIMTGPAQLRPNSFILNHWLNLSLRASDLNAILARYKATKSDIQADLETFAILWDGCRRNLDRARTARSQRYFTPRQLLLEMRTWYTSLPPENKAVTHQDFTSKTEDGQQNPVYTQIIRCFCLHSDLHGTYCALEDLHNLFNLRPTEDIATMILMQVARMAPTTASSGAGGTTSVPSSKPRRPAIKRGVRDQQYRSALGAMAQVLQGLVDWKSAKLIRHTGNVGGTKVQKGESQAKVQTETQTRNQTQTPTDPETEMQRVTTQLATEESILQQEIRLDAVKTFLLLVLKRMKEGKREDGAASNLLEEIRVAGANMGVDVDIAETKRRVEEADEFEEVL